METPGEAVGLSLLCRESLSNFERLFLPDRSALGFK
jgi:hypothetical protein